MNTRIATVVTAATLVFASGCCTGMKNFMFGRGARCGLCSLAPKFGNTGSGCFGGGCLGCGGQSSAAPMVSAAPTCTCQEQNVSVQSAPCTTCLSAPEPVCGNDGYMPMSADPYLGGAAVVPGSSYPVENVVPYQGGSINGGADTFNSRSGLYNSRGVDYDGAKIISESPLPPGAKLVN
jgi:hypothetical protein